MATPDPKTSSDFSVQGIFAWGLTKRQPRWRGGYKVLSLSRNCLLCAAARRLLAAGQVAEPLRVGAAGEWRPRARGVSAPPGERPSRACGAGYAGRPQHQREQGGRGWANAGGWDCVKSGL